LSTVPAAAESAKPVAASTAEIPVLRIAPPSRWWVLPFAELWEYRELLYFFVWRDIKIRYKQTVIGVAWAVLQPFLMMLVYSLIFGRLAHLPTNNLPFPIFYYSGLLPWMFFSAAMQSSTNTIVENQRLITKVYFPRLQLPFSSVLAGLMDFSVSFLMFVAIMVYFRVWPTLNALWFPLFLLLGIVTALGVGLWLSALNAIYRDVRYILPFLIQFWMIASPVAYPASLIAPKWRWLYGLNPMAGVIEGIRWSLTAHGDPPGRLALTSTVAALVILASGIAYFQRVESTIADVV
jgi:lipopolysaccharide transport system permease protein